MEQKLIAALAAIAEKAERRAVLLSEIKEWDDDLMNYVIDTCGHWSGVIEDGELRLGRLLRKLLEYKHYRYQDNQDIPYHCYAITPDDVLFIDQELPWDDEKGEYTGIIAETFRNMSWKLKHPAEYAELEAVNKQLEEARARQQSNSSGCASILLIALITTATLAAYILT